MQLLIHLIFLFGIFLQSTAQFVPCFEELSCSGNLVASVSDAEMCCLNTPALSYDMEGQCINCFTFGFLEPVLRNFESGPAYAFQVGYIKNPDNVNQALRGMIQAIGGTAGNDDFSFNSNIYTARRNDPGEVLVRFLVDNVAQEQVETAQLQLNILAAITQPPGLIIRDTMTLEIVDSDIVVFQFAENNYQSVEDAETIDAVISKNLRIANPVTFQVFPYTVQQAEDLGLDLMDLNIPPDDNIYSPNRAQIAQTDRPRDFDLSVLTVTFEADEDLPNPVNDVPVRIPINDDDIDEAQEEVFIINMQLQSSINPTGLQIGCASSLCRITDNDVIQIGFQSDSYTFPEPDLLQSHAIFLEKQNGVRTEQTYVIVVQASQASPPGVGNAVPFDGTNPNDYTVQLSSTVDTSTLIFLPNEQTLAFGFTLFGDQIAEGLEAFQVSSAADEDPLIPAFSAPDAGVLFPITFINIADDDDVKVGFEQNFTVPEDIGSFEVCFRVLFPPDDVPLTINIDLVVDSVEGTANELDYVPIRSSAFDVFETLSAGRRRACFNVMITDNNVQENTEQFSLALNFDQFVPPAIREVATIEPSVSFVEIRDDEQSIECPLLPDITNGMITYAPDMTPNFLFGTTTTYECDKRYFLNVTVGDRVRTCEDDDGMDAIGVWSGMEPSCVPIQCLELPPTMNGFITYTPHTVSNFDLGTVATYDCNTGFDLDLSMGAEMRTCVDDNGMDAIGVWTDSPPTCILVCADLAPFENGRIEYSRDPPRVLGTVATHTCCPTFFLNGPMMRTCVLRGGIGIFDQRAPVCEPIQCKELPRLANGIITYASDNVSDFDLDTTATYDCNTGFILDLSVGAETRTCVDDDGMDAIGVWSGMAPSCVRGCQAEEYMNHTWPNTRIGTSANSSGCQCEDLFGVFAGNVRRLCSGDTINEAVWNTELDFSGCEVNLSEVSQQLCNIALGLSSNNTVQSSKEVVNITSNSQDLSSGQVTVVATVVEHLTDEATVNPEVRENYLETIDNIQQADPDRVFESQEATNSSTRILTSLETFLDNLDLDTVTQNATSNQTTLAFSTFAVQVKEINADDFNGQTFSISLGSVEQAQNTLTDGTIDPDVLMVDESGHSVQNTIEEPTAFLQLPPGLLNECETSNAINMTQRISYSMFLTDTLFSTENRTLTTVGSIVVGARLRCQLANKTMLSMPVNASFRIIERPQQRVINRSCAVYSIKDRFGAWDSSGCKDVTQSNGRVECVCSQLGHFGILFNLNPKPLREDLAISLSVITYIGLFLSLCCLMVFVVTVSLSRKLRANTHNLVLLNMSIALIGLYISFLVGGFVQNVPPLCGVVSALLQYFFLVFFSWTAVEAVWLCIKLVVVIGTKSLTSKFLLKTGLPAWFIPVVIVIISAGAGHEYYSSQFYCRPTEWPFYFGFILPFLCIYLLNWTLFIAIMVSLCRHARNSPSSLKDLKTKAMLKSFVAVIILSITLGLGWGFGLVTTSSSVTELNFTFQVIFSVFVGLQGVLIFGLHGVRNKDFRDFWTGLCGKSRAKYPVSSSVNLAQKSDSINKTETLTMKHSESEV